MTAAVARSCSPVPHWLLDGHPRRGRALGVRFVDLEGYVLALTLPGGPRMPNGIETSLRLHDGAEVLVGDGSLSIDDELVAAGPGWDPTPTVRMVPVADRVLDEGLADLVGWGPGLTPLGDDLRCGFLAGCALLGGRAPRAALPAHGATTSLSCTLLRHARRGELPEPAHALLERGCVAPLQRFGASSGGGLLVGLALAAQVLLGVPPGRPGAVDLADGVLVWLPLPEGPLRVVVGATRRDAGAPAPR